MKNAFHLSILSASLSLLIGVVGIWVSQLPAQGSSEPDDYAVEVLLREALGRADARVDSRTESLAISAAGLADSYAETIERLLNLILYGSIAFLFVSAVGFSAALQIHRAQNR